MVFEVDADHSRRELGVSRSYEHYALDGLELAFEEVRELAHASLDVGLAQDALVVMEGIGEGPLMLVGPDASRNVVPAGILLAAGGGQQSHPGDDLAPSIRLPVDDSRAARTEDRLVASGDEHVAVQLRERDILDPEPMHAVNHEQ